MKKPVRRWIVITPNYEHSSYFLQGTDMCPVLYRTKRGGLVNAGKGSIAVPVLVDPDICKGNE